MNVSKEELIKILDCITFEPVPGKDAWGKINRDDRQFINGQISEYGKKQYVKFGQESSSGTLKVTCVSASLERDVEYTGK